MGVQALRGVEEVSEKLIDPQAAVDYMIRESGTFAKAKGERIYMEEFRKSKKALLMKSFEGQSIAAQERDAYAHPDYIALLDGLRLAVEAEEAARWMLIAAQARVEVWRSQEASARGQDRATR